MKFSAAALLCLCACNARPVEVHAGFSFSGPQERAALVQAIPHSILVDAGGLPDPWPDTQPRLLLDLEILERARIDFTAANLTSDAAKVRVSGVRAKVAAGLQAAPAELRVYAGPVGAATATSTGVVLLARGAWTTDAVEHGLPLEPSAPHDLAALVSAGTLQLLVTAAVPYDTKASPHAPTGTSAVDVWLELELAP